MRSTVIRRLKFGFLRVISWKCRGDWCLVVAKRPDRAVKGALQLRSSIWVSSKGGTGSQF